MSALTRRILAAFGLALVLGGAGWTTWRHEQTLAHGKVVLLELAPVDPRSLMQGDYMQLRFAIASKIAAGDPDHGRLVLKVDSRGVGTFARLHKEGVALAADEQLLEYRVRDRQTRIVTDAYFFQEGTADRFTRARYGELRVREDGVALLAGLRGAAMETLGSARP
ncbi:GDYXXLXY domain-containing protein [Usitatibacter palustris]|uniref:Membrane-anchored protein n=1 Tax=Usitatibacter palustris TaxID=2732487 RepID=A0A6M4H7I3_9PROT|nr:GDYXXLXY domain-containing protein [Usitatibacter palustris]QJR14653.1 hypothetical protein DSM104440_01463 [Usitatibacter palustris]